MRILILDDDPRRGQQTAGFLRGGDDELIAETPPIEEGLQRLEDGEWFDLILADPPERPNRVLDQINALNGSPPVLLVSSPGRLADVPRWVDGVLARQEGYEERLPEAARLTVRVHRLRCRMRQLETRLTFETRAAASHRARMQDVFDRTSRGFHRLLHALHAKAASSPEDLEIVLQDAEKIWEHLEEMGRVVEARGDGGSTRSFVTATALLQEAVAGGLDESARARIDVAITGTGRVFIDMTAVAPALGETLRAALRGASGDLVVRARCDGGNLHVEIPWRDRGFLPSSLFEAANDHDGGAGVESGTAFLSLPLVREEEIPAALVEEALRRAEDDARDFTLMRVQANGGAPLDVERADAVLKRTDRVLPTPDGGLLVLLPGLAVENAWAVATRLRDAVTDREGMFPFRTLSYPTEACTVAEFLERAVSQGMLPGKEREEETPVQALL